MKMKGELEAAIAQVCKDLFGVEMRVVLSRPDEQFGDYATNIALQLAGKLNKKPRDIAEQLIPELQKKLSDIVDEFSIAGPGFINIRLSDAALQKQLEKASAPKPIGYEGQTVVFEYSDPNPFKVLHAGHLYQGVVGDAIVRLLERAGADLHPVNFGGDVGLHVAKNMWAILQDLNGEHPEKLEDIPPEKHATWLSECYVKGNAAYEDDETAKAEIIDINQRIYRLHEQNDHDSPLAKVYWTCRQWSYDYFDAFYARVGSHFEKYYPESVTAPLGIKTVKEQFKKGIYEESDGAIVFKGEPYGLHTRVFINSNGLPTYEAKDVGLSMAKWQDYHFDRTIIFTGNDIVEYMKVVLKSIEQFAPELAERTTHLTHGNVKLVGGVKMSSRKGNFLRATDVIDIVTQISEKMSGHADEATVLGAIKYAFIKHRIGADIIFDPNESVSLQGSSGPYLQYAHARARSVLAKAIVDSAEGEQLEAGERSLARKITEYPEVVQLAVDELMPHHIATYLYELAQTFNNFYEHNRVIGESREAVRVYLVKLYADTLKDGLELLGIHAPNRM
jgi:arginyl-tRNA synthetase